MTGYEGDLSPQEAWALLESDPSANLVDVRTNAEWSYVGVVDLRILNREPIFIEWQHFPDGRINPEFVDQLESTNLNQKSPVLFLCRSGVRSVSAAIAATERGFDRCYNIAEGFEGDPDADKHRGLSNGWKVRGLPWIQG